MKNKKTQRNKERQAPRTLEEEMRETRLNNLDTSNASAEAKVQEDQAESLARIAAETEKANKIANNQIKDEKDEKKKSLVRKTFDKVGEGAKNVAGSENAKTMGRGLMDATPMGRFLGMINDSTGLGTKALEMTKKGYERITTKAEEQDEVISDSTDDKEDSNNEVSGGLSEVKSAIDETTIAVKSSMPEKKDKDVLKEEEIQKAKDREIFTNMRDYLHVIARFVDRHKADGVKGIDDGDEKEKGGFLGWIAAGAAVMGKKLLAPFKLLGAALFGKGGIKKFFKGFASIGAKLFGKGGFGSILKIFSKGLKFLGPLAAVAGALFSGISGFMDAEEIFGKDATIGNKISSTLGGIASGLTLGFVSTETMAKGIQKIGDSIASAAEATWNALKDLGGRYVDAVGDSAVWLKDKLIEGIGWYGDTLRQGADYLLEMVGSSVDDVAARFSKTFDDLIGIFQDAVNMITNLIPSGVKDAAKSTSNWISDKYNSAKSYVTGQPEIPVGNKVPSVEPKVKRGSGVSSKGGMIKSLKTKVTGLKTPILKAWEKSKEIFGKFGVKSVVTSGTDGKHGKKSLHGKGMAIDLRTRDFANAGDAVGAAKALANELNSSGTGYDVVYEGDHIHVEYDPKGGTNKGGFFAPPKLQKPITFAGKSGSAVMSVPRNAKVSSNKREEKAIKSEIASVKERESRKERLNPAPVQTGTKSAATQSHAVNMTAPIVQPKSSVNDSDLLIMSGTFLNK